MTHYVVWARSREELRSRLREGWRIARSKVRTRHCLYALLMEWTQQFPPVMGPAKQFARLP